MDDRTLARLRTFLADTRKLPNEVAKTARFLQLVTELYPGSSAAPRLIEGLEDAVRIELADRTKRGRIDAYYGNAIIEFEKSLAATGEHALEQLREYASGVWAEEGAPYRSLLCVATDGETWKVFAARLTKTGTGKPGPEDVELDPLREIVLADETLRTFWIWLTSFLFRDVQVPPTAERVQGEFGSTSPAYRDALRAMRRAWETVGTSKEAQLAFDTWRKYLTVTYGDLGKDDSKREGKSPLLDLFLTHTYLASVARLLVWAALSGGRSKSDLRDVARSVLSGDFFRSENIDNLVEDDFFQWVRKPKAEAMLAPVWERALAQMQTFDLSLLSQDVLKGVYQELVDPKERHDLGEYYTPEWLCERIVEEVLPKTGFAPVLDPTCGSGSFLRASISHYLRANPEGSAEARLQGILGNVVGIDIHPMAVTIARATYVLAIRSLLKSARRPIHVPVYLADALFLPSQVVQSEIGLAAGYEVKLGKGPERRVSLPAALIHDAELFDPAIGACARIAVDHAKTQRESSASLAKYLGKSVPKLTGHPDAQAMIEALWTFTEELADLIRKEENSIWAFIVRNAYRPAMLRDRFEFIVGNPPWLSYRYIADPEYQAEVKKRAVEDYAIAPNDKKLFTQMELATVFLAHTLSTFGKVGCRLAFVMPRSVLSADQHARLRARDYKAPIRIDGYWDLRDVRPVFSVPCCVLFAVRENAPPGMSEHYTLPASEWSARLGGRDEPWSEVEGAMAVHETTARLLHLGYRTALATSGTSTEPGASSAYTDRFRQGATIVPRSFYFVAVAGLEGRADPDRVYHAATEPEQAKGAKKPYRDVKLSGAVEGRFLFATALSKHIVPFGLRGHAIVALPIEIVNHRPKLKRASQLNADGCREMARWMERVEHTWNEKRDAKAKAHTASEWLDYGRKLTDQRLDGGVLVLYNAAGTNLSAVVVDPREVALPFIVDHKLYWMACRSREEADYLAAILNAGCVNDAIKPFQSTGLMGERDIHKKVLELPIPSFDAAEPAHVRLADLGARASLIVSSALARGDLPKSLGPARARVREQIGEVLQEIDRATRILVAL